jgi:putative ABC transport system substrate-binding protein
MRQLLLAAVLSVFLAASAHAQEPGRTYRVGVLVVSPLTAENLRGDFLPRLAQLGFSEGRNLIFDMRLGRVDQLPELARDLATGSDVIVAMGWYPVIAARGATRTLPIVTVTDDPTRLGFAQSLSRPGGNVTGIAMIATGGEQKQVELLRDAVPTVRRIAVLTDDPLDGKRGLRSAMADVGVEVRLFHADRQEEIPAVFAAMREAGMEALWMDETPQFHDPQVMALALEARLPTVCAYADMVPFGCMLSYSLDLPAVRRRVADYVARILRGESPAEMPIEQPMHFTIAVNLRTARSLGLTLPQTLLVRADEVIE